MQELGFDISGQESKTLDRFLYEAFDAVITVCDQANEACPVFFGARERLHWGFPDPSKATGSEDEQFTVYREVRDAIGERIELELLAAETGQADRGASPTGDAESANSHVIPLTDRKLKQARDSARAAA